MSLFHHFQCPPVDRTPNVMEASLSWLDYYYFFNKAGKHQKMYNFIHQLLHTAKAFSYGLITKFSESLYWHFKLPFCLNYTDNVYNFPLVIFKVDQELNPVKAL